jgi:hypothetical protein
MLSSYSFGASNIYSSTDGSNWVERYFDYYTNGYYAIQDLACSTTRCVAVGDYGKILYRQ